MSDVKKCRDCGLVKSATEFWKRRASKDGLSLYCKECFGLRNAKSYRGKREAEGKRSREYRRHSAVPEGMKYCPRCKEIQQLDAFGSNRSSPDGRAAYCKPCHNRAMAEIRVRNHGSSRNYLLKLRYGITEQEADALLARQGGICVICLRSPAAHVDHGHETGLVRSMLCFGCNGGLGQFEEDVWVIKEAADYLERLTWHARMMRLEFGVDVIEGWVDRGGHGGVDPEVASKFQKVRLRYGIGERDAQLLFGLQKGRCAICCDRPVEHVDHCHDTEVVRGMLCGGCNTGMGQLRDDPGTLRRAADYLLGELVVEVPVPGGGTRLSFTVPDVDPTTVPLDGWDGYRVRDAAHRKALREAEPAVRESWIALPGDRAVSRIPIDRWLAAR
ncbi:endonuclease VII domain-containing protein [Actinomadura kijaniata]|uniref:endonuclease VII domain-containing protein n=1 Tax=Actinomadura kijaniata TaxID=46161 RepID=UPI001FE1A5CD|nr:endonuclease VII domain-containing protein [Actinomadura kijaniata]